MKARAGVLISGSGSNLQALMGAAAAGAPFEIATVISNNPEAYGLTRATQASVPAHAIDHRPFGKDRAAFEAEVTSALRAADVEWVALAGFMRVLTPGFVAAWTGRLINIHPSLLPLFPGLNTHARALEAGMAVHGCTVHHVTEGVDEGPIIGQACVPVRPDDTPETLAARVNRAELRLYPAALAYAVTGQAPPIAPEADGLIALLRP
jgi:phosphoribosylglycinamide formyltransferase-1